MAKLDVTTNIGLAPNVLLVILNVAGMVCVQPEKMVWSSVIKIWLVGVSAVVETVRTLRR